MDISYQQRILEDAGIQTARLDVLAIYEHVLGVDKSVILAGTVPPTQAQRIKIKTYIAQRSNHVPLAYILKQKEFYGRTFYVDKSVLIPRPESEAMIDLALRLELESSHPVTDIGCGSGILGITFASEKKVTAESRFSLTFTDISESALALCRRNARAHSVRGQYKQSDLLLDPYVASRCNGLIFANLPYVPEGMVTSQEINAEPAVALFSGTDGLKHYQRLWGQIASLPVRPSYVITESLETQFSALDTMAEAAGFRLFSSEGLARCYAVQSL